MPVIGLLDQRSPDELADRLRGFRQGLRDSDFVEGQNVVIDYRWAQNKEDRLPELSIDCQVPGPVWLKVTISLG
jgi:putative ABC transport system substrate-binding protein